MRGEDMIRKVALAVCLLALVVTVALWIVSWIRVVEADIYRGTSGQQLSIMLSCGRIIVVYNKWTPPRELTRSRLRTETFADVEERHSRIGFKSPGGLLGFLWELYKWC